MDSFGYLERLVWRIGSLIRLCTVQFPKARSSITFAETVYALILFIWNLSIAEPILYVLLFRCPLLMHSKPIVIEGMISQMRTGKRTAGGNAGNVLNKHIEIGVKLSMNTVGRNVT